jgi:hypothetical protein
MAFPPRWSAAVVPPFPASWPCTRGAEDTTSELPELETCTGVSDALLDG